MRMNPPHFEDDILVSNLTDAGIREIEMLLSHQHLRLYRKEICVYGGPEFSAPGAHENQGASSVGHQKLLSTSVKFLQEQIKYCYETY